MRTAIWGTIESHIDGKDYCKRLVTTYNIVLAPGVNQSHMSLRFPGSFGKHCHTALLSKEWVRRDWIAFVALLQSCSKWFVDFGLLKNRHLLQQTKQPKIQFRLLLLFFILDSSFFNNPARVWSVGERHNLRDNCVYVCNLLLFLYRKFHHWL